MPRKLRSSCSRSALTELEKDAVMENDVDEVKPLEEAVPKPIDASQLDNDSGNDLDMTNMCAVFLSCLKQFKLQPRPNRPKYKQPQERVESSISCSSSDESSDEEDDDDFDADDDADPSMELIIDEDEDASGLAECDVEIQIGSPRSKTSPLKERYIIGLDGLKQKDHGLGGSMPPFARKKNDRCLLRCEHCQYSSNRTSNMTRHYYTMHTKMRQPQECCGSIFHTRGDLQAHNRKMHACSKYPCPVPECAKLGLSFDRRGLLKRHMNGVHYAQRPHKCTFCTYSTSHRSNLERHVKALHGPAVAMNQTAFQTVVDMDGAIVIKAEPI